MPIRSKQIAVFDTETTGVDVESDRIVTAFIGLMDAKTGELTERHSWLLNPGVEIPEGAAAVHGITTERAIAEGRTDLNKAIFEIVMKLDVYDRQGIPVVIYNAPFDLTLLDREARRHVGLLNFRPPRIVIDPLVLDKALDKYRKGSRKLVDVARHWGVKVLENAHDAEADCIMSGHLAIKILASSKPEKSPLRNLTLEQIHRKTIPSHETQVKGFRAYLHQKGEHEKAQGVLYGWPWRPLPEGESVERIKYSNGG